MQHYSLCVHEHQMQRTPIHGPSFALPLHLGAASENHELLTNAGQRTPQGEALHFFCTLGNPRFLDSAPPASCRTSHASAHALFFCCQMMKMMMMMMMRRRRRRRRRRMTMKKNPSSVVDHKILPFSYTLTTP